MRPDTDNVPAIDPGLPAMPFDGKNGQQERAPVIAHQITTGDQVLREELWEIMPVLDESVLEDEIIVIPEHGIGQAIDIGAHADGDEKSDGNGGKGAGIFNIH